ATVIAYANIQEVMASDVRQRLHNALPMKEDGQRELQEATGINLETDVDRVVACLHPDQTTSNMPGGGMILARGRFDETKIETLMGDHGAQVEDYRGKRLIVGEFHEHENGSFALSFIEPGFAAFGSTKLIRSAIDLHQTGDNPQAGLQSVVGNEELMKLVHSLDGGNNAWAVGRFDAL